MTETASRAAFLSDMRGEPDYRQPATLVVAWKPMFTILLPTLMTLRGELRRRKTQKLLDTHWDDRD